MRALLSTLGGAVMALALGLGASSPGRAAGQVAAPPVDFARDVRPILEAHCYECHGPNKSRGRLRLDQKASALRGGNTGPLLVAGDGEHSTLVRRLLGLDGEDRMPLDKDPLPPGQIALLRAWIDQGAPWPDDGSLAANPAEPSHWAYRTPRRPAPPDVRQPDWVHTPIDAFVLARLAREGLKPSPEASREALLRRLSLDLVGLPPTPAELDAFVADTRADAYERQVDRLLASPHYGERWARPWLDLARYADSNGYEKDRLRTMWKYRDWVIAALNADMPFDRFTIEQIAGDMLPGATEDQRIASGFHRNTLLNQEGGIDVEEARWEALLDRVNTTATVWLGSTIACAQCHNHKYDPFSQRDYYRLLAFFDNVEYSVGGATGGDRWIHEPTLDLPTPEQAERRAALLEERRTLDARLTAPDPAIDAEQRDWERAMRATDSAWTTLPPRQVRATGARLLALADGSVLASGPHPGSDRYIVETTLPAGALTGIRLEALPHTSLPKGGPGRDHYGNFVITGFTLELVADDGTARRVAFGGATSDDAAGGDVKELIADTPSYGRYRDLPPGWSIDATREEMRLRRQAVFTPRDPLTLDAPARARIRLGFDGGNVGQAMGRFRLSTTAEPSPAAAVSIRARVRALLDVDPSDRTDAQREAVRAAYRAQAPALAATRRRVAEIDRELAQLGIVTALVMREKEGHERPSTPFRERGAFLAPGDRVFADTPDVLPPLPADVMPNRLGLARWLVHPDNPLTARVAVNRAWEQFFGIGLVETSEDFGTQGAAPSHPELLDWLATEFVRLKWSQKKLHRLIVTSATYRQSATVAPALVERDPYNRLLARGPRQRLSAEAIRDVALAASGLLSPAVGGPSVFPPQPEGIWDNPYSNEKWITSEGPDRYRRGLYTFIRRTSPYPVFMTFDATSREYCAPRRVRTNTPLQALAALNDEAFFEAARALARRMMAEAPGGRGEDALRARAAHGFRLSTSRRPSSAETDRLVASYRAQHAHYAARIDDARRVANRPDASDAEAIDLAAWTLVANALLNLDETLTK